MKSKLTQIINNNNIEIEIYHRVRPMGFGIFMGCNSFTGKRPDNFFIEIDLVFWTFGFEIKR